jgi:hypothetical protein
MNKNNSKEGSKSNITFRHEISKSSFDNGKKIVEKEKLMDGAAKGISFFYLFKNDKEADFIKITGRQEGEKWFVEHVMGTKPERHELDQAALLQFVKAEKKLEFVAKYLADI